MGVEVNVGLGVGEGVFVFVDVAVDDVNGILPGEQLAIKMLKVRRKITAFRNDRFMNVPFIELIEIKKSAYFL